MSKFIKFDMLNPASDHEFEFTFDCNCNIGSVAEFLAPYMKRCVVSNVSTTDNPSDYNYDECYEIVWNVTDDDPLADLTETDAIRLIHEAQNMGYAVPAKLTPELFLEIYNSMKPEEEK